MGASLLGLAKSIYYYHYVRDTSRSVIFSTREVNIAVLDMDVFS